MKLRINGALHDDKMEQARVPSRACSFQRDAERAGRRASARRTPVAAKRSRCSSRTPEQSALTNDRVPVARASGRRRSTRRGGGLLRVENRACSAPRLLLCLGQRDELLHVTWHRVEPTAGPLLLRLLNALWPG